MANIGTFTRTAKGYTGEIATLTFKARVAMVEIEKTKEDAPDFRLYAHGGAEIGAAWTKTTEDGLVYHSLKLDDPSFAKPLHASLFADRDHENTYNLVWNRPNSQR